MSAHGAPGTAARRALPAIFLVLLALSLASSGGAAPLGPDVSPTYARWVRSIDVDAVIRARSGLAYVRPAHGFVTIAGKPSPRLILRDHHGITSRTLPLPGWARGAAHAAFDDRRDEMYLLGSGPAWLARIPNGEDDLPDLGDFERVPLSRGPVDPRGMTVDPETRTLFVLDAGPRLLSIDGRRATPVGGDALPTSVVGLAWHPVEGVLYTLDPEAGVLLSLSPEGDVLSRIRLPLRLERPAGLMVGPNGDSTDGPMNLGLYILDAGTGRIHELAIEGPPTAQLVPFPPPTDVATLVATTDTSLYVPPSPDAGAIAYLLHNGNLLMGDGEVDETIHYAGANLFEIDLSGNLLDPTNTLAFSAEPAGMTYDPDNGHLFIADDNILRIFELDPGPDVRYGTGDDSWTSFSSLDFGSSDPEGAALDTDQRILYIIDGLDNELFKIDPGPNGMFEGASSDDIITSTDTAQFGLLDPEGVYYDDRNGTLLICDSRQKVVLEMTTGMQFIRFIDTTASAVEKSGGITLAPGSVEPGVLNMYIADRGIDNDADPNENDGKIFEMSFPPTPMTENQPPFVAAGVNQAINIADVTTLAGSVLDEGLPFPPGGVSTTWSREGGPAEPAYGDASQIGTTVSFPLAGTYVLRLTGDDGEYAVSDTVSLSVFDPNSLDIFEAQVSTGDDDAEEQATGVVNLTSSDIELVKDGTEQTVGLRFNNVMIPRGVVVLQAYVQFTVDETSTVPTNLVLQAEDSDDSAPFTTATADVSSRPRTTAFSLWSPPSWLLEGEAGLDQRSTNMAAAVQQVIERPGWSSGNSLSVIITGTGDRVAESFDGSPAGAAVLHVEYITVPVVVDEVHWTILGQDSVGFSWRSNYMSQLGQTIEWGTSPGVYTDSIIGSTAAPLPASSAGAFIEAVLTGLSEDTLYYYRIGEGPEHTFRTPPPHGTPGFWIGLIGDVGSQLAHPESLLTQQMLSQDNGSYPDVPGVEPLRFVIVNGDLTLGDIDGHAAVGQHFVDAMEWSRDVAYMPAWGDHEDAPAEVCYSGQLTPAGCQPGNMNEFEGRFILPNPQASPGAPAAGGPADDWYWFDYGNVRFIAVPEPHPGTIAAWETDVEQIMAAAQADADIMFIVTFGHRQTWSSGADHGDASGDELATAITNLGSLHDKLVMHLSAHARSTEISDPDETGGIVHLRQPGGGATLGGLEPVQPSWSVFRIDHLTHSRIHFDEASIQGFIICGPDGSGATDACTPGEVVHTFSIPEAPDTPADLGGRYRPKPRCDEAFDDEQGTCT